MQLKTIDQLIHEVKKLTPSRGNARRETSRAANKVVVPWACSRAWMLGFSSTASTMALSGGCR